MDICWGRYILPDTATLEVCILQDLKDLRERLNCVIWDKEEALRGVLLPEER